MESDEEAVLGEHSRRGFANDFCGGAHCAALMKLGAWMRPDGRMRNPTERSRESLHLRRASFGPSGPREGLMLAH